MRRRAFLDIAIKAGLGLMAWSGIAFAQRGGRSANRNSSVNRKGSTRSGSSRSSNSRHKSSTSRNAHKSSSARQASGRRSVKRRNTRPAHYHSRHRARRVSRSRRYRRGRWRHHCYWRHRRWYRSAWVAVVFITVAIFASLSSSPTTYTYDGVTYYRVNPWYRRVYHEGEDGYVNASAPVGHREDDLPDGAEEIQVDGKTLYYGDGSFWEKASSGGFVVVTPPVGAEVSSLPEGATPQTEGEVTIYQFDELYLSKDVNDSGKTIYRVEPAPPEEELESIPSGTPSFVADQETYYYVNSSFYVEYQENGKKGFVNGEPDEGAQTDKLPEGTTNIEEEGVTYYQFDSIFFEEVEDDDGTTFFEVVGSPDGSDVVQEN